MPSEVLQVFARLPLISEYDAAWSKMMYDDDRNRL